MMPTTREFLGDSLIKELEGAGFSPQSINAFAKNEYRQRKAAQEEEQRRLLYRADDMKLDGKTKEAFLSGEINEQEAKNAQKFEEFGSKKHGWALGAAKTVTGIANTVERAADFINPFYEGKRDKDGNYIYQNGLEKSLRSKIKNVEKMRDDYEKATGETSWGSRLAEIGTEMVGDPINFVGGVGLLSKGSKLAQFGKKTLYFAGTGAASGGVAALGEGKNDEETLKNIGYGAAGGALLGHAIDKGIQGISKLIAKRQASKMANEADAIESAENSEFLNGERAPINTAEITASKDEPLLHAERSQRDYATKSLPAQTMTAKEFATKEMGLDEDTATNVLKEAMQGKEKSEFIDADSYNDIVKFKNFEVQREYAKAYGEKIQTAQTSINNAREQSAIRYADTQKAISEYQKQGMSPSAIRELINAKFKPSADEIDYTRAYNDGTDVDARLTGQGIFYALEKDIVAQAYTPEIYATRLKQRGFSDESVQAFTQAYVSKDIDIAKDYVNSKVADAYESRVQREVANEIRNRDEIEGGFVNEEAKNNGLSDSVSDIGDNASRTGGRQASDEQILRQGGRNTSNASQTKRTAQSDEQMEQQSAFKTDGDTDATASSKQMVEKQGRDNNEIKGDGFVVKNGGKLTFMDEAKFELSKELQGKTDLNKNLAWLHSKHPEMFENKRAVKELIDYVLDEPNTIKAGKSENSVYLGKKDGTKIKDIVLDKSENKIIHANRRRMSTDEIKADGKDAHIPLHTDTMPAGATGANARSSANESIIPQKEINAKTINANSHIASGLIGGTLNSIDEDGNFNPNRFAAGFLAGLAGSKAVAIATKKMTPQLYNKILGAAKKMPQMAKDNPKLLGKLYANGKDVSLNSFAGEKAITANVGKLDQAKAMLEKGADEVEIWQKTGWFKDKDGAWKFEIGDSKAKIKNQNADKLGDLLEHKELFKAYPELKDIKIKKISDEKGEKLGYYDPNKKEIGINNIGDKSTLMHEVQHAIQDIEGFAKGSGKKGENYRLSHGEAEARNVQNRLNLGDKFRAKIVKDNNPVGDDYHAWIRGENDIKTFKQAYDDDGGGDLAPDFTEAMAKKAIDSGEITVYSSKPIKAGSFVTPSKMEAKSYAGSGKIYEEKLNLNDISWIDALQGQVTRNKDIHPYETFDVNPNETIVSKDGMINLSHELEKKYILKDGSINEAAVRKEAEPFIEKEYSLENFKAEFPNGKVDTPIGEVAVSNYQFEKLNFKGREKYLGLIKPTLERPAFVVDFEDTTFFFKPFRDKDGVVKFASVIKERDGGLDVTSNYPMANRKFELITREGKIRYVQGSVAKPVEHSLDDTVRSSAAKSPIEHSSDGKDIIPQNEEKVYHSRKIEEIKREHPDVEKELDESIASMRKESFNSSNFKDDLISKIGAKDITTKQLGKSVDLSDKQLAVLKNDIKNADFKVISDGKIYFDKMGKDGDKKRFFIDIAEDGKVRVDGYSKKGIDTIPVRQSALEELAGVGDRARLKNMSFEVKAAYFNELDPIKKEAILKTAELNKLKRAAQSGDKMAVAKFEEFRAKNLDENGNIKDGLSLC